MPIMLLVGSADKVCQDEMVRLEKREMMGWNGLAVLREIKKRRWKVDDGKDCRELTIQGLE